MMWKKIVLILALSLPLQAWPEYFVIRDYQVLMEVHPDGSMKVTENILVDFSESRRGIYRTIPIHSYVNGEWKDIRISKVKTQEPKKIMKSPGEWKIRFGESDVWIPAGEKLYSFSYEVNKVMLTDNTNYDELYWNAIGTQWEVPIYKTGIKVTFPEGMKLRENMEYRLYIGKEGDTTEYHDYEKDDWVREEVQDSYERVRDSRFTKVQAYAGLGQYIENDTLFINYNNKLQPREGITLQIRLNKGFIKIPGWQHFLDFMAQWYHLVLTGLLFLVSLLIWNKYGKDEKVHVMVEFFPPKVSPSEASSILKQGSSFNLSATIVDLARRGYLVIGEDDKKKKYVERLKGPDAALKSYEKKLMEKLFKSSYTHSKNHNRVYTDKLTDVFYSDYEVIKNDFSAQFDNKGYFTKAGSNWKAFYVFLIIVAAVLMVLGLIYWESPKQLLLFLLLSMVNNGIFAYIMPQKSDKGLAEYRRILGFKEFIRRAEADKIMRLFNQDQKYFDETIAYAMALGLAGKWARMFDNLMQEPPQWYRGYNYSGPYRVSSFLYSVNAFSRNIQSNATSSPSSSGSSSGGSSSWSGGGGSWGGSSGGGFGGGGGGSW